MQINHAILPLARVLRHLINSDEHKRIAFSIPFMDIAGDSICLAAPDLESDDRH